MGNGISKGADKPARRQSAPPSQETRRHSTAASEEAGRTIVDLDEHTRLLDFQTYSSSEEKLEKPDIHADDNLASEGSKFKAKGAGPFKSFHYSSDVPFDDAEKLEEFKFWVFERCSVHRDWERYTMKYRMEPDGGVGITFSPRLVKSPKKDEIERLEKFVAQAEQNVMAPVIAQSKSIKSENIISATRVFFKDTICTRIHNIPNDSNLPKAMANITNVILGKVHASCEGWASTSKSPFRLYGVTTQGAMKFENINSEKFESALLESLMNRLTELRDTELLGLEYDIHKLNEDKPMVVKLRKAVESDLAAMFPVKFG